MARTILLADDSVTIQKVVELTFLDEDFRVVSFANGSDAIARIGEIRPDVVLADVHMPGADGYEVCAAARAALPGVPVLLLVGTFEVFDADRASQAGAAGHLKKPFDSQELLRRVQELASGAPAPAAAAPPAFEEELPPIDFGEPAPPAAPAPEPDGESWSFEPVADEAPAGGEVAPDTWGGVVPEPAANAEPLAAQVEAEPDLAPAYEPEEVATPAVLAAPAGGPLSDADVDRIARRVVELLGDKPVRDVAWEVVPDLAEVLLKARIRELEASVE
jgi:CheY-like chemotaxis protein